MLSGRLQLRLRISKDQAPHCAALRLPMMTLRPYRISVLLSPSILLLGAAFLVPGAQAQTKPATQDSPYGGVVVEDIVAQVNDRIITRTDYDRAMKEMDDEARQRGANMQQIGDAHRDLLRNLIDQQLWLSKGKELGITGDTELVKQLDDIRKKYNLASLEDLEKAAKEQGVSYDDFKANIRNQIITQQVMRDEVGRRVSVTPGEVQRYFEAHKQDYTKPESIHLSEILVSTGDDDPGKVAAAKAKADDIEAKLKAGASFDQLARTSSDGTTAAQGGDLGSYSRGSLNKVFEDATFGLKVGEVTAAIRTKQGYVIFKVVGHDPGGVPQYKDVEAQVEDTYFSARMEPAIRTYLGQMREEAAIFIRSGYTDSAATPNEIKPTISYSAYAPPAPKKKKKVQRTRFRETEHTFRSKSAPAVVPVAVDTTAAKPAATTKTAVPKPATEKPGKKEKIRYGQAPRETLPNAAPTKIEDAGALPKTAENKTEQAENVAPAAPVKKTRYTERAKLPKTPKPKGPQLDSFTPAPPDAGEVADRQTQSAPLGLNGDTAKKSKKKKTDATTSEKTRMQNRPKSDEDKAPLQMTPAAPAAGAPGPATAPKPQPSSTPASTDQPQSTTPAPQPQN